MLCCGTDSWSGSDWCGAGRVEALSVRGVYLWHGFTFLSSRFRQIYRKQERRGNLAADRKRATKVPRKEKSAWEPCENGQLPNELGKTAKKRNSGCEPDEKDQFLKCQGESSPEGVETWTDESNSEGIPKTRRQDQREAIFAARRNEYLIILYNRGSRAQEEMASFHLFEENLRHYHCLVCKEAWPLSGAREDLFTCSRCKRDKKPS